MLQLAYSKLGILIADYMAEHSN